MNKLSNEKQIMIASMLVEGNSIRSIERVTGVHRDTIMRLGIRLGELAREYSNNMLKNIKCNELQIDEIWSYVGKKKKNLKVDERKKGELGDQYIFVALDAETKLIPHYEIGKRTMDTTLHFLEELRRRIATRFQLTSDSFRAYAFGVDWVFGNKVDYAQLHKVYANTPEGVRRYSPANIIRVAKQLVLGDPNPNKISTSYVERQNLTMRMQMRRLTRLTNAFSKKLYNLQCAVDLHFFHYNFMRIHQTLRVTPAMEAGITRTILTWNDLLNSEIRKAA